LNLQIQNGSLNDYEVDVGPQLNSLWAAEGEWFHCGHPPSLVLGVKMQDRHLG